MASIHSTCVLVVSDEPETSFLYNQKFRKEIASGMYKFSFYKDGDSALVFATEKSNGVDIMIVDINIPGLSGIDLVARVTKSNKMIPCIVISTYGNIRTIRSAMQAGASDFLIKPTDFNDLADVLKKASNVVFENKQNKAMYDRLSAITDELNVSARLQKSILPGNTLRGNGVEIYAQTTPAAEVGGDFYDFFWINDHMLGIVMADVSGKNVSAALFMTMTRTLIKSFATFAKSPADCFSKVNVELLKENVATMFVTSIYGIFNTKDKTFTYTNAGHLPIAFMSLSNGVRFLECDSGMALGIDDSVIFQDNVLDLQAGDSIMLYTDGVSEAINVSGEEYDFCRLENVLRENRNMTPKSLTDQLLSSIKNFTAGEPQSDDITTLCLKYRDIIVRS